MKLIAASFLLHTLPAECGRVEVAPSIAQQAEEVQDENVCNKDGCNACGSQYKKDYNWRGVTLPWYHEQINPECNGCDESPDVFTRGWRRDHTTQCVEIGKETVEWKFEYYNCNLMSCWGMYNVYNCGSACCAGEPSRGPDHKCSCLKHGAPFDQEFGDRMKRSENCCSQVDSADNKCGCAEVNSSMSLHGAGPEDCCSGKWEAESAKCIARQCSRAGTTPTEDVPCCRHRTVPDGTHANYETPALSNDKCGCFHAGQHPTFNDMFEASDCCSGEINPNTGKCKPITDPKKPLEHGANKDDCSTGEVVTADGKSYCKASTCTPVGEKATEGNVCCSGEGRKDADNVCLCVKAGEVLSSGQQQFECCSETATNNQCDFMDAGEHVPDHADHTVCGGGHFNTTNGTFCACYPPGATLQGQHTKGQCCSGETGADGKVCSCATNGHRLNNGMQTEHCCSKREEAGICSCSFPGFPIWPTGSGKECCSQTEVNGNCGCLTGVNTTNQRYCCGSHSLYVQNAHKCLCIPGGVEVASYVPGTACCSGAKDGTKCGAE